MPVHLAPALFVLLWSTGYIASKLGAPYAEPFTFLSLRFAIVLAILVPACLLLKAPWPRGAAAGHAIMAGTLIHGAYLGGAFWAVRNGMPAGMVALIVSLQPITTSVFAAPLLGERVRPLHWLGLALGLVGVVLVVSPKLAAGAGGAHYTLSPQTIVACAISLVSITFGTIYQKRTQAVGDLRTSTALQFVGAVALCTAMAFATEQRAVIWSGQFVFALGWLVLVLSIGAISLLMIMIRRSAVSQVAGLFYLVPAVTALMAWGLFGEVLTLLQLVGMALVTAAVLLISRIGKG